MQIMFLKYIIIFYNGVFAHAQSETRYAELGSFTRAANVLNLTQPAVSHHIKELEQQLGVTLFLRKKGQIQLTPEGEIVVQCVRRMKALEQQMMQELKSSDRRLTRLRVGITHTAESNLITEVLAKFGRENDGVSITITTDTIKNLYDAMEHFELDLAVVDSTVPSPDLNALMLDTDCIVCVLSNNNPLSRHAMVTLEDLKKERMILRLPSSATRKLFEALLLSLGMSIDAFDVAMEVDNIATIKDLIRKDLGVSILARSACMDELRKGKLTALPIENLSMVRQMNLVYRKDFQHMELLYEILRLYHDTAMQLQ